MVKVNRGGAERENDERKMKRDKNDNKRSNETKKRKGEKVVGVRLDRTIPQPDEKK